MGENKQTFKSWVDLWLYLHVNWVLRTTEQSAAARNNNSNNDNNNNHNNNKTATVSGC